MDTPPTPPIPPFHPRQRRADMPPISRRDYRAARFRAIRSRQPPLTSLAACARYRIGRKTAIRHCTLMRRLDGIQKDLIILNTHILHLLLHTPTILPPGVLAAVIHDIECASSLYRSLSTAGSPHNTIGFSSSLSTLLHSSLKLTTPPSAPSSMPAVFFGG
ncbi:hypothetical protein C8R43DRAFT_1168103 [Mycena crocata]|nr:hypothetical protein C8R43DRAFT_1168103 [Mycena crocata]